MNHNLIYLFGMYELDTDSIVIYANDSDPLILYIFTGLLKMLLCCMQNLLSKQMACKDM